MLPVPAYLSFPVQPVTLVRLSELLLCVRDVPLDEPLPCCPSLQEVLGEELDHYNLAKSYFDLKEYDRCVGVCVCSYLTLPFYFCLFVFLLTHASL